MGGQNSLKETVDSGENRGIKGDKGIKGYKGIWRRQKSLGGLEDSGEDMESG